jgi:anti-sigma regulatory factor (Ser/Thr protein kinase)
MSTLEKEMAAKMGAVSRFVTWAERAALRHSYLSKAAINAMRVCIQELVSNIVLHTKSVDGPPTVRVALKIGMAGIIVCIEDNGPPFDPMTQAPIEVDTDLASADRGGRGLRIVRNMSRRMSYERSGEWNRVRLEIA